MDKEICPISQEAITTPAQTICGHTFELEQIQGLVQAAQETIPTCPVCRGQIFDFAAHTVPLTIGQPPVVSFSTLAHNLNLSKPQVISQIYLETSVAGLELLNQLTEKDKINAEDKVQFNKVRLALFTIPKRDKEHLEDLKIRYQNVATLYKQKIS